MYLFIYEFTPNIGTREENSTQIGSHVVLVLRAPLMHERRTTKRVVARTKKGLGKRSWGSGATKKGLLF